MKQIITKFFLLLFLSMTISCGFKVLNESEGKNFSIKEINTFGDKRINFKIKNNLLVHSTKNNQNILLINLNTKKTKNIKEKNIKNEITKYQLSLNVNIQFSLINDNKNYEINISNTGEYLVADGYSTTLNNEKKLIDNLIKDISQKILKKISLKLDDI